MTFLYLVWASVAVVVVITTLAVLLGSKEAGDF
jgi:hypothetical protein